MAEVAIDDYTEDDVELPDATNGEYLRQLESAHVKYDRAQEEICAVLSELKDSDIDKQRKQDLALLQIGLSTRWKDSSKGVRSKAADLEKTVAQDEVARRMLPNVQQLRSQQEAAELRSRPVRRDVETPEESETEHTDGELGSDMPRAAPDPKGSEQPMA